MSRENVDQALRAVEAFNRRDLEAFLTFVDQNAEFATRTREVEGGGAYRGHDGVRSWWDDLLSVTSDMRIEIVEIRDLGEVTLAQERHRGHGASSGAPMEQVAWHPTRWRDGKAVWWRIFGSEPEAQAAVAEQQGMAGAEPVDAMSSEHLSRIRSAMEAFNRRDFDAAMAPVADDVTWDRFLSRALTELPLHGKEAIRAEWESQVELMEIRAEPEELIAVGADIVVVPTRMITRGRDSAVPLVAAVTWLYTFAGETVQSVEAFDTREEALGSARQRERAGEDNIELAHRGSAAFNRRDLDAYLALADPEVEFSSSTIELEGGGPYRGHEGVRRWWDDLLAVSPDFQVELEEASAVGCLTVERLLIHGHGFASGAPMERRNWRVNEWRRGKVVWSRTFGSEAEALEAARMAE